MRKELTGELKERAITQAEPVRIPEGYELLQKAAAARGLVASWSCPFGSALYMMTEIVTDTIVGIGINSFDECYGFMFGYEAGINRQDRLDRTKTEKIKKR